MQSPPSASSFGYRSLQGLVGVVMCGPSHATYRREYSRPSLWQKVGLRLSQWSSGCGDCWAWWTCKSMEKKQLSMTFNLPTWKIPSLGLFVPCSLVAATTFSNRNQSTPSIPFEPFCKQIQMKWFDKTMMCFEGGATCQFECCCPFGL